MIVLCILDFCSGKCKIKLIIAPYYSDFIFKPLVAVVYSKLF